jgi:hypothetical protein
MGVAAVLLLVVRVFRVLKDLASNLPGIAQPSRSIPK